MMSTTTTVVIRSQQTVQRNLFQEPSFFCFFQCFFFLFFFPLNPKSRSFIITVDFQIDGRCQAISFYKRKTNAPWNIMLPPKHIGFKRWRNSSHSTCNYDLVFSDILHESLLKGVNAKCWNLQIHFECYFRKIRWRIQSFAST